MLTYCKHCVMPDTKPDLHLDEQGVCNACRSYEKRKEVDWDARRKELLQVLERTAIATAATGTASFPSAAARTAPTRSSACCSSA